MVQTIDTAKLATALSNSWGKQNKPYKLKVMIQINTSGEESKLNRREYLGQYIKYNFVPCSNYFYLAIVSNVVKIKFFCHLPDKSGCPPESSVELVKHIMDECPSLQFSGIMTIGALARSVQQEETNEDFDVGSLNYRIQKYNAYKSFI
jgi:hypothetical protein